MTPSIKRIIVKYLTNSATKSDLDTLSRWIENPDNIQIFKEYVETHIAINYNMSDPENEKVINQFLKTIKKEKSLIYKLSYKYAVAASIFLFASLAYFFNKESIIREAVQPEIVNTKIKPGTHKAILTLENGSLLELDKGDHIQTSNANSNGEQIVYKASNIKTKELKYNYLTIPRGGEYYVVLSDGTKVWLNSETQLKYPVKFIEGKTRMVELVYGEAYFDVSPSTEHKGAKFKVLNQEQEIEVLGTEFNIKAYKDEASIYTTLVEGKVVVNTSDNSKTLKPNEQSNLSIQDKSITIASVNIYNEISWKDGIFSFRKKPLIEIMKVLSRWYDMDVVFINSDLENLGFNGVLGKDQKIEDILTTIKNFGIIKDYKISNKTVILK